MKTEKLNYYLPPELIAQQPCDIRGDSRLLVLNRSEGGIIDSRFKEIAGFLRRGDCLVLNDTRVLQARFFAQRQTGGKLEGLFLGEEKKSLWQVMLKGARKVKIGQKIQLKKENKEYSAVLIEKLDNGRCLLEIETDKPFEKVLDDIGYPPLPPYIKRTNDASVAAVDKHRYQTVYADKAGAVAAPTAGLHFTEEIINGLKNQGLCFANITLHVGAGTFKPVNAENLEDHKIHKEIFSLDEENCRLINSVKQKGGRLIAVGTTAARTLETVAVHSQIKAASGETSLFILPGYKFKAVDALITNFHLPKSTLLALVGALAGLDRTLAAYQYAIEQRYRFYSYGDAMLII